VSHLETQIEQLKQELRKLQTQPQLELIESSDSSDVETAHATKRAETSNGTSNHLQNLVSSVRDVVVEPSKQPRFLGQSSGITLARMVMASIRMDALPATPAASSQSSIQKVSSVSPAAATEASLPPRHAANHLVDVYFQYRTPHLPIIERSQVEKAVESAYAAMNNNKTSDRMPEKDIFTTYMVLAIALCNVPNPAGGTSRPLQSEGCFRSAIGWIEKIITYSKSATETLRAVLLLAQFVSMCPWRGSLWHLTGIALRLCVDMGLHWETDEQALSQEPEMIYDRRRLWHSAYQFDRVLGITLGRPFGIMDENVRVPLPNPWAVSRRPFSPESNDFDTHHQRAHNHLFSLAKLESEIKHVQHSQSCPPKVAYPKPNYVLWLQDIQPRLQEWCSTVPNPDKAHPSSIFASQAYWDGIYNNAILLLHRPSSSMQQLPSEALSICYDASCKLIASIKILQREGRLDVLWKAVHDLFMAGLTVIYCVWQSSSVRSQHPVSEIIATLQSCASLLSAMSENFSGAIGCRDAFDTLSAATVNWLVTNDEQETIRNRVLFEKQVGDLLGHLQPSGMGMVNDNGTNDMSTMLSSENFAFGEMLNSAAQWPDFQDINFDDMGFDAMTGTTANLGAYTIIS
jgi:Fungal specific transcription factor domain